MFDPREPYNDLPLVSSIYLELTPELNNLREEARVSIELLNYALKSLPNSEILLDTLALQEAKVSSNIENIRTTNDDLLRAVAFKDFNAETKAIVKEKAFRKKAAHAVTMAQAAFLPSGDIAEVAAKYQL